MAKGKAAKRKAQEDLLLKIVDLLAAEGQPLTVEVRDLALDAPQIDREGEREILKIPITSTRAIVFTAARGFRVVGLKDIKALIQRFQFQDDLCWVLNQLGPLLRDLHQVTRFSTLFQMLHRRLAKLLNLSLIHTFDLVENQTLRFRRVDARAPEIREAFRKQVGFRPELAYFQMECCEQHPLIQSLKRKKPRYLTALEFMEQLPLFPEPLRQALRPVLEGYHAFILPVWDSGGVMGVLFGARPEAFSERERMFLETLAQRLGRVWRQVQITEEARALQDLLSRMQRLFARALQGAATEDLLDEAFQALIDLTGAFKIACFIEENGIYRLHAQQGLSRGFLQRFREAKPGDTLLLKAVETRKPVVIQEVLREVPDLSPEDQAEGYHTLVSVPLFEHGELRGALSLLFARPWQGTGFIRQVLKTVANFLSIAIQRAELEKATQHQQEALRRFTEVLRRLTFPFPPDELVENLMSVILELPMYHHVGLWEVDPLKQELRLKSFRGLPVSVREYTQSMKRGLLGKAARTGETVWANDTTKHPDFITALPSQWFPYSEICVPLKDLDGSVFGVLQVQSRHRRAFTPHDVHFLEALGSMFSLLYQTFDRHQRILQRLKLQDLTHRFLEQSQVLDTERVLNLLLQTVEAIVPEGIQGLLLFPEPLRLYFYRWQPDPSLERQTWDLQDANQRFLEWVNRPHIVEIPKELHELPLTPRHRLPLPEDCPHRYLYPLRRGEGSVAALVLCSPTRLSPETLDKLHRLAPLAARALYNAQRHEQEREVRQHRESVLEFSPDWIVSVTEDGTILYSNFRAFQALGDPPESLIGRNLQDLLPMLPIDRFLQTLRERGSLPPTDVAPQVSPNAEPFAFWNISGSRTPSGHYVFAIRDMTSVRKMDEDLPLVSLSSAVAEMAAGVAHEVNNPLTGVIGILEYWLNHGGLHPELREDLEKARSLASQASYIVREMLSLAGTKKRVKPQPFDLDRAVDQILNTFDRNLSFSGVKIKRTKRAGRPIYLWGYEGEIQQVLVNLLLNARDAIRMSRKGDEVEVITDIESSLEGDFAVLVVRDNGPGIPRRILPRIFAPFFTTKPPGKGTGLGLALCARIVREHNGTIQVETEEGKGTAFIIRLPLKPGAKPTGPKEGQPSVLIGEFEPFLSRSIKPELEKDGVYVDVVTDGPTFQDYVSSRTYQLLIVNAGLPDFNLDTFYRWLKNHRPDLVSRLVVIVDQIPLPERLRPMEEDGVIFLLKPVSLSLILITVRSRYYVYYLEKRIAEAQRYRLQQSGPSPPEPPEESPEGS